MGKTRESRERKGVRQVVKESREAQVQGNSILSRLFVLQDREYGDFQARLIPGISRERIIGVRTPDLRRLARELAGTDEARQFLQEEVHSYYEENNLHGILISGIRDYEDCVAQLERFLPQVDNWATCDLIRPAVVKKHLPEFLKEIRRWLCSDHTYTIRFAAEMLMCYYLDEEFEPEYLELVCGLHSEEYYVKMMIAWYFATALAKQYEKALPFLEEQRLDAWTHNKTIQKAVESFRIKPEQKEYLKRLRRPSSR